MMMYSCVCVHIYEHMYTYIYIYIYLYEGKIDWSSSVISWTKLPEALKIQMSGPLGPGGGRPGCAGQRTAGRRPVGPA